ncbi:MAG: Sec-independent protein translocase subunit TatA [Plesiomonas sp.]
MGGISIWQLLIIAVIVVLLFGTKKLRNIGGDLGGAVRDFKKALNPDEQAKPQQPAQPDNSVDADFNPKIADQRQSAEPADKSQSNSNNKEQV